MNDDYKQNPSQSEETVEQKEKQETSDQNNSSQKAPDHTEGQDGSNFSTGKLFYALEERINLARKTIKRAPYLKENGKPLYRVPWFLFLEHEEADGMDLLQAANIYAPLPPLLNQSTEDQRIWNWWFFRSFVGIQFKTDKIGNPNDQDSWEIWKKSLSLLKKKRAKLPLNGIPILISANTLKQDQENIRIIGKQFRSMIDEAYKELETWFPVYIIITNCNQLNGYEDFFGSMPTGIEKQAVGHRIELQSINKKDIDSKVHQIYDPMVERFHAIRLDLLKMPRDTKERYGIFDFVENVKGLKPSLMTLCDALFTENPYQYDPFWRGLYFTSAKSEIQLLDDIFAKFLPSDNPLARKR